MKINKNTKLSTNFTTAGQIYGISFLCINMYEASKNEASSTFTDTPSEQLFRSPFLDIVFIRIPVNPTKKKDKKVVIHFQTPNTSIDFLLRHR